MKPLKIIQCWWINALLRTQAANKSQSMVTIAWIWLHTTIWVCLIQRTLKRVPLLLFENMVLAHVDRVDFMEQSVRNTTSLCFLHKFIFIFDFSLQTYIWSLRNVWPNSWKWRSRWCIHMDSQQRPVQLQPIANAATWYLCKSTFSRCNNNFQSQIKRFSYFQWWMCEFCNSKRNWCFAQ